MLGTLRRSRASFQCLSGAIRPYSSSSLAASRIRPVAFASCRPVAPTLFHNGLVPRRQQSTATAQRAIDPNQGASEGGPVKRFAELATLGKVNPVLIDIITNQMRLETMTDVQSLTVDKALLGVDVYVLFRFIYPFVESSNKTLVDWRRPRLVPARRSPSCSRFSNAYLSPIRHWS